MTDALPNPADKVQRVDINDLQPHPKNSRKHPQAQLEVLAGLLTEYGFTRPVLRNEASQILFGHGVVAAAKLLISRGDDRFRKVPVITARGWDDAKQRAYIVADNRSSELSAWDDDILKAELADLQALGFDMSLTAFSADDLHDLFNKRSGSNRDPDAIPPVPEKPVSQAGDLWRLGDHWLICGDATDPDTVAQVLAGKEANALVSDPPYGIGYRYNSHDDSDNGANAQLVAKVFALGPPTRVWTPGLNNLGRDLTRFGRAKVVIWVKGFAAAGNGIGGANTWEPILVVNPKRKKLANDVLEFRTDRAEVEGQSLRELHPCPKPVALFQALIEAFVAPKGIVYDPFSGSGTSLISCQLSGRVCRAVEIDPAYVDVCLRRWMELTGFEAFHESGLAWSDIVAKRGAPE